MSSTTHCAAPHVVTHRGNARCSQKQRRCRHRRRGRESRPSQSGYSLRFPPPASGRHARWGVGRVTRPLPLTPAQTPAARPAVARTRRAVQGTSNVISASPLPSSSLRLAMPSPPPSQHLKFRIVRRHRRILRHRLSVIAVASIATLRLAKVAIAISMVHGSRSHPHAHAIGHNANKSKHRTQHTAHGHCLCSNSRVVNQN